MKNLTLEEKHCKEVLDREMLIGSENDKNGQTKGFTFNAWSNTYSVWQRNILVDRGPAHEVSFLLRIYNKL